MAMFEINGGKNIDLKRNSTDQDTLLRTYGDIENLTAHDNQSATGSPPRGCRNRLKGFFAHGIVTTVIGGLFLSAFIGVIVMYWPAAKAVFR